MYETGVKKTCRNCEISYHKDYLRNREGQIFKHVYWLFCQHIGGRHKANTNRQTYKYWKAYKN